MVMTKRKDKSRKGSGGVNARSNAPQLLSSGAGHKTSSFERMVQRVKRWFGPVPDEAEDEPINEKYDPASQRMAGRESREDEWYPLGHQKTFEPGSNSSHDTPPDMSDFMATFKRAIKDLHAKIEALDRRLSLLEGREDSSYGGLASDPSRAGATDWRNGSDGTHENRGKHGTPARAKQQAVRERHMPTVRENNIETVEQVVCRALDEVPQGGFDLESLVEKIEALSSCKLDKEFLGPHFRNEWRMVILWLEGESEGMVLVSPGELVDSEITQYFEVDFGRRILSCRRPARVVRRAGQVDVSRKGLVENS